jgi:two-component system, response regulator PdtaR
MPSNALLVMRKPELNEQIRAILVSRGYGISGTCTSGAQGLIVADTHAVDVSIVGYALPDMTGLEFAMNLLMKRDCSVLLLTPPDLMEYVKQQSGELDIVALPKPATAQQMLSALELIQHYRTRLRKASDEANKLKADLDRRALAEKAKVALMHHRGMSEAEAWRYLQKRAMDTGRTLKDVAQQVLEQVKK